MKNIKYALVLALALPAVLWLLADSLMPDPFSDFSSDQSNQSGH